MTGFRTGQLAEAAGVNRQTLRYYEKRGLLAEPDRTLGGHRLYPTETLTVLRVIKTAQSLGFTLDEVAELLNPRGRRAAGLQVRARRKLDEIETQITRLSAVRDTLRAALDAGCDDLVTCAEIPLCGLPFPETPSHTRLSPTEMERS